MKGNSFSTVAALIRKLYRKKLISPVLIIRKNMFSAEEKRFVRKKISTNLFYIIMLNISDSGFFQYSNKLSIIFGRCFVLSFIFSL